MSGPEVVDAFGRPVRVTVGPAWTPARRTPRRRPRGRVGLGVAIDTEALLDRALAAEARAWLAGLSAHDRTRVRLALVDLGRRYAWGRLRALEVTVGADGEVVWASRWEPPPIEWP